MVSSGGMGKFCICKRKTSQLFTIVPSIVLQAMKTYGLILADNGSAWYISGAPDSRWDNDVLVSELAQVKGSDFEAVDVSSLMADPDSGLAVQGAGGGGGSSNNGGLGGGSGSSSGGGGGGGCFISVLLGRGGS